MCAISIKCIITESTQIDGSTVQTGKHHLPNETMIINDKGDENSLMKDGNVAIWFHCLVAEDTKISNNRKRLVTATKKISKQLQSLTTYPMYLVELLLMCIKKNTKWICIQFIFTEMVLNVF